MRKLLSLTLTLLLLLQGCQTAPRVVMQAVCPAIPSLDQTPAEQVPDFSERIACFLQGKLPEQCESEQTLPSASASTKMHVTN